MSASPRKIASVSGVYLAPDASCSTNSAEPKRRPGALARAHQNPPRRLTLTRPDGDNFGAAQAPVQRRQDLRHFVRAMDHGQRRAAGKAIGERRDPAYRADIGDISVTPRLRRRAAFAFGIERRIDEHAVEHAEIQRLRSSASPVTISMRCIIALSATFSRAIDAMFASRSTPTNRHVLIAHAATASKAAPTPQPASSKRAPSAPPSRLRAATCRR
jgi:hypothetical protein